MNPFTRYMKDNNEPQEQGSQSAAPSQQQPQQRQAAPRQQQPAPRQQAAPQKQAASSQRSSASAPQQSSRSAASAAATRKSSAAKPTGGRNILSADVEIKGKINFTNDLVVDGKIEGEIVSDGSLTIGENARIKAQISTRSVVIYGKVYGNIKVTDHVELKKDAELVGDIKAATMSIEAGAIFVGNSSVGTPTAKPEETPSKAAAKPAAKSGAKGKGDKLSTAAS